MTPLPLDEGATGLGLALRQLPVSGGVLYITAHPDDENNGVLVMLNRGRGVKTALLTVTRGDGGQNEIGPELFDLPLGNGAQRAVTVPIAVGSYQDRVRDPQAGKLG